MQHFRFDWYRTKEDGSGAPDWDWRTEPSQQKHGERVTMIRPVDYESTNPIDPKLFEDHFNSLQGRALTLNISSGGMLLLMDHAPALLQLFRLNVPVPIQMMYIPTLAEVAWTRPVPMGQHNLHFVGLKFVL